jgi:hypothetical protein
MDANKCRYISKFQKIYNISIEVINDALSALRGGRGPPMDAVPVKHGIRGMRWSSRKSEIQVA